MIELRADSVLTFTQALQLVGLTPCLFVVIFLIGLSFSNRQAVVPVFYFLALACSFALPLVQIYSYEQGSWLVGTVLFGESMLVSFSFLLILQFMTGRIPSLPYWLVLAIPLLGGGFLIYASLVQAANEPCIRNHGCFDFSSIKTLYNVISSALVFLLLMYYSARIGGLHGDTQYKRHKYWLIISLISLNLFLLAVDLAKLSSRITITESEFISVVLKLSFIYLVITSLFRVFYPTLVSQMVQGAIPSVPAYNPELDLPHVEKIRTLFEIEHTYREMRLNRAALARLVGINEHHLSRIINRHFSKNFNELINGYRIEDAKRRLRTEPSQITTIAFEVGFNSIASFNRVFKDLVGTSPTEYRNSATQADQ